MPKLKVTRKSEWMNRARQIGLYLNDQKLGTILNNETLEFDIPQGSHKLRAKIDWCYSRDYEFSVTEDDEKSVTLSGFKYSTLIMPISFGVIILHFIVKTTTGYPHLIFLIWPVFLVLLYYTTIARKDFLVIEAV